MGVIPAEAGIQKKYDLSEGDLLARKRACAASA